MNDLIIERLLNMVKDLGIRVEWSDLFSEYTPPASSAKHKSIVMNNSWHNPTEIPFQLAHEIAHVQNHDDCEMAFYHASFSSKERIEREANVGAIKLLLPIFKDMECSDNPVTFMKMFNIPGYLFDNVIKSMKNS